MTLITPCPLLLSSLGMQGCSLLGAHLSCDTPPRVHPLGFSAPLVFLPGPAAQFLLLEMLNTTPFLAFLIKLSCLLSRPIRASSPGPACFPGFPQTFSFGALGDLLLVWTCPGKFSDSAAGSTGI